MEFNKALREMKAGKKVKLPSWGGYWYWNPEKETIMMHTKDGIEMDIRETQRVEYTLSNVCSDKWIIANESNCPELGGEALFDFGDALEYLKRGLKIARKGWNGKDQFLVYVDPYENEQFDLVEKESLGTFYPYIAIKTNYNAIVPWLASQTDMLAEDWMFIE